MRSSHTITLFTEPPPAKQGLAPFGVSMVVHCAIFVPLTFWMVNTPQIADRLLAQRNTVHILDLHRSDPQMRQASSHGVSYSVKQAGAHPRSPGGRRAKAAVPREIALSVPAPQTIVQPDLPPNLVLPEEMPVPQVLLWSGGETPPDKIVPPAPHEASAPDVRPSLDSPNQVAHVADVKVTSTAFTTDKLPVVPSTTSPVVRDPEPEKLVPETASKLTEQPTRARVMTLSDIRMPEGMVVLPKANETALAAPSVVQVPGTSDDPLLTGDGNPASSSNGVGSGQGSENPGEQTISAGGIAAQNGADVGTVLAMGTGTGKDMTSTHITLPKDGQFGVVVVGSSLEDEYPEMVGQWSGRVAYTVYLHVGQAKSWILQYSLPLAASVAAQAVPSKLESPWPYDMVRPNLAPGDLNADALIVHGLVNQDGLFEGLNVVFPAPFAQAKFVLDALKQWRFRPAMQDGQNVAVEVLLIIPDELQ